MKKIDAFIRPHRLVAVKKALDRASIRGMSVTEIKGFGRQGGHAELYRGTEYRVEFLPKIKIDLVVKDQDVEAALSALTEAGRTGEVGDGKIFITPVDEAIRIRTGETGEAAL